MQINNKTKEMHFDKMLESNEKQNQNIRSNQAKH